MADARAYACRLCGCAESAGAHVVPEMMFGSGVAFDYDECAGCGSWQIARPPDDLGSFYPESDYYSFTDDPKALKNRVLRAWQSAVLPPGRVGSRVVSSSLGMPRALRWVGDLSVAPDARILDVGCGDGRLAIVLARHGYHHVTGIDPFRAGDETDPSGARILRRELADLDGRWDVITFHHSWEHLHDPVLELERARERLAPGGRIVVRCPIAQSWAHRTYGSWWVQLDAPRHLVVPSVRGLAAGAARAGLSLDRTVFDSAAFQMWASEQYREGGSLRTPAPHRPADAVRRLRQTRRARQLNAAGDGDQAGFYLSPV